MSENHPYEATSAAPSSPPAPVGPAAPGQAQHPFPTRPATGAVSWALGFVMFVPIPFLSIFLSGIAMAIPYGSMSRRGDLARANARSAANWGLTLTIASTLLLVLHFVLVFTLAADGGVTGFYPLGTAITVYGALVLLHIVLVIVGTVRASQGKVTNVPFAIPFFRR